MTPKEIIETLIEIVKGNVERAQRIIKAVTGESFVDCELMNQTFESNRLMIKMSAHAVAIDNAKDWIEWYIYDADYGQGTNQVVLNVDKDNEEHVIVDSVDKLLYVMNFESEVA